MGSLSQQKGIHVNTATRANVANLVTDAAGGAIRLTNQQGIRDLRRSVSPQELRATTESPAGAGGSRSGAGARGQHLLHLAGQDFQREWLLDKLPPGVEHAEADHLIFRIAGHEKRTRVSGQAR